MKTNYLLIFLINFIPAFLMISVDALVDEQNPQEGSIVSSSGYCPKPDKWYNRQIETSKIAGFWKVIATNYEVEQRCSQIFVLPYSDTGFDMREVSLIKLADELGQDFPNYELELSGISGDISAVGCEPGTFSIIADSSGNLVRTLGAKTWVLTLNYDRFMALYTCREVNGQYLAQIHIYGRAPYLDEVDWTKINSAIQQSGLSSTISVSLREINHLACPFFEVERLLVTNLFS